MLCDAHNHLQDERLADHLPDILASLPTSGIRRCVINGTHESDWPRVAALARAHPELLLPSFGLHPWFAHDRSPDWLSKLTALLEEFPHAGIGECGLDRWMRDPDPADQKEVFVAQLELATRLDRPLSIHCLKAWGALLEILKAHPRPNRGFLLHSYGGSAELVGPLSQLGAYFSFSGYFLDPRKEATRAAFRLVPPGRLLLESDAPDMLPPEEFRRAPLLAPDGSPLNHPGNLPGIAGGLATALDLSTSDLTALTNSNFARFFETKNSSSPLNSR